MKHFFFLLIMPAALLAPDAAAGADKAGDVVRLRGTAVIQRDARTLPVRVRSELRIQDAVQTRSQSRVKMLFLDDSVLTLGENSRLIVQQHLSKAADGPARSLYHLIDGRLKAVVGRTGFMVRTPTAFAAARGTVFRIWYDAEAGSTGVEVLEGLVEVSNVREEIAGSQMVNAGQFTIVPRDGPPSPPQSSSGQRGEGQEEDAGGPEPSPSGESAQESLRDSFLGLVPGVPPIEQVPAPLSRVNLNLRFRFP